MPSSPAGLPSNLRVSFVTFVLEQLRDMEGLGCRAMFGGHGLYAGPTFFGILYGARLYLKTGEPTVAEYAIRGMGPFRAGATQVLKTYYEVPADVLENGERLREWAAAAVRCAATSAGALLTALRPVLRKLSQ